MAYWAQPRTWTNKARESDCLATIRSGLNGAATKGITPLIPAGIYDAVTGNNDRSGTGANTRVKAETNGEASDCDDNHTPILADKLLTRSDLRNLPDPEPLIDDVLDQGTTALLYGKWSTAKTFIALDWAASVATGRDWQARASRQRRVLYVVGEGAFGFKGRVMRGKWVGSNTFPTNG